MAREVVDVDLLAITSEGGKLNLMMLPSDWEFPDTEIIKNGHLNFLNLLAIIAHTQGK